MKHKIKFISFLLTTLFCSVISNALLAGIENKSLPNKPNPPRLVNDFAGILSNNEVTILEQKLVSFNDSSSNQIAIVTVANMGDYVAIEDFAYDLGKKWGVGTAKKDNGILVVVSMAERKSRVEVGSGLEGAVPDLIGAEVLRNVLKPAFKQGLYFDGFNGTIDNLIAASKNEYTADAKSANDNSGGGIVLILIFLFIIMIIWIKLKNAQNNKYYMSRRGGRGWNDPWIGGGFIGGGSGGGFFDGGGDSGGGGFGGFGGGGFSGGGASGDW